jgi:hypothetical protein
MRLIADGLNGGRAKQDEERSQWLKSWEAAKRQREMLTKPLRLQG